MYAYINKNIPGKIFRPSEALNESNCDILGSTAEDYESGMFVSLTEEQALFAESHPKAAAAEILSMQVDNEAELKRAKEQILMDIDIYDQGREVNGFTINGVEAWFTPLERANYKQSVESAKLLNVERLQFFVGDTLLSVSTTEAEQMLAMIQLYADSCFIVTKTHKLNIENATDLQQIANYDITQGYPVRLNFEIEEPCITEEE